MKSELKYIFDEDDPDDRMMHLRLVKSLYMSLMLLDIRNLKIDDFESIEQVFETINNLFDKYDIDPNQLVI